MKLSQCYLYLWLLLSFGISYNAQAQNKATISVGLNAYTLNNSLHFSGFDSFGNPRFSRDYMTTGGAAFGAEYSLSPKNWSIMARASMNFASPPDSFISEKYRAWAFMTGINFSPGESQKGFVIGPRIGFRSDNLENQLSLMIGIGMGFLLYPTDQLMIGLYGEPFWDTITNDFAGSFGMKLGYSFVQ